MKKIFEKDTIEYLKELRTSDKEIKGLQFKGLKKESLHILKTITKWNDLWH